MPDWAKLSRDDEITLQIDGKEVTPGCIDMLGLDGSVLWLFQNEGKQRAMFHQDDGLFVFRQRKTPKSDVTKFYKA